MKPTYFLLVFAITFALTVENPAAVSFHEVLDIIKIAKDVVVAIAKTWNLIDEHVDFDDVPLPLLDKTEKKLFGRINVINQKLDALGSQVDAVGTSTIASVLQDLPERIRLELRLNDLLDYLTRVDVAFRHMQEYSLHQKEIERATLEDFSKSIISHDSGSVYNLIERIHAFIVPNGRGILNNGILSILGKQLQWHEIDSKHLNAVKTCMNHNKLP